MRPTHPLALLLQERLRPGARVLYAGSRRSRNAAALAADGFCVESLADAAAVRAAPGPFDGALSTHALLHGTAARIADLLDAIADALEPGAPFHATFGNPADARFGRGIRIDDRTFAPEAGDEAGVAHAFFDEGALREMLGSHFAVESVTAERVDDVAGTWAHGERPLRDAVHWFVVARRAGGRSV